MSVGVSAFVLLSIGLLLGKVARIWCPLIRRYYIPSSIIGGLIALVGGPEIWGRIFTDSPGGLPGKEVYDACRTLPGFLINVVFAALFLGTTLPPLGKIWQRAGPQVAFGQAMAWGMYMVGLGVTLVVLIPVYDVPPVFGTLLEIGFEGGHGTAAGLEPTFNAVGWAEGTDLALGVATVGMLLGVGLGMVLINWAVRANQTVFIKANEPYVMSGEVGASHEDEQSPPSQATTHEAYRINSIEPISLHAAYVGVSVGVGVLLLWGLVALEGATLTRMGVAPLFTHVPLFPLAMVGGIIVQGLHNFLLPRLKLSRSIFTRIQGVALDYLIVSAMASLSLRALAANWQPLVILMVAGTAWTLFVLLVLGPRMLPDYWFERGIGDFGQSMGVTATGLLLLRVVDPEYRSPAYEAFGYKQLLFEPFVGGGLVTSMAVPLVFNYGAVPMWLASTLVTIGWIAFGLLVFGPAKKAST